MVLHTGIGNEYIRAAVVLVGFFLISKLFVYISEKILVGITKKTRTTIDDAILKAVNRPISLLLIVIGARIAVATVTLAETVTVVISMIIVSIIWLVIIYMIAQVLNILVDTWGKKFAAKTKSKIDDQLVNLAHKSIKILSWIVVVLVLLDVWGVEITPLLASLGIAGLAVAFALQNTLANVFGGVALILDKSVKVGDVIILSDSTQGTVMDIGLRSTKIRTWDGNVIIVPNGKLVDLNILNRTQPEAKERVEIPFGAVYGADVQKVKSTVLKEIKKVKGMVDEPAPFVRFLEMGDSALLFKAYFWVEHYGIKAAAKDQGTELVYNALHKAGIEIPFPQMDVHLKK